MKIKKKYIKLFENSGMSEWEEMSWGSTQEKFNIPSKLAYHLMINYIQWVKRFNGKIIFSQYGGEPLNLDNLEYVGGYLNLRFTNISSLKNLEYVGGYLDLGGTDMSELPSLKYVGGDIIVHGSNIGKNYLLNKRDLVIKGEVYG